MYRDRGHCLLERARLKYFCAAALPTLFARIESRYGLAPETFVDMFDAQGHACAVCRRGLVLLSDDPAETPVVDHNHSTGQVRGILCRTCNIAVGYIEKDRARTKGVLSYLKRTASAAVSKGPPMWRISRLFGKLDTDQPTG